MGCSEQPAPVAKKVPIRVPKHRACKPLHVALSRLMYVHAGSGNGRCFERFACLPVQWDSSVYVQVKGVGNDSLSTRRDLFALPSWRTPVLYQEGKSGRPHWEPMHAY